MAAPAGEPAAIVTAPVVTSTEVPAAEVTPAAVMAATAVMGPASVVMSTVMVTRAVLRRHRLAGVRIDSPLTVVPVLPRHPAGPGVDHHERCDGRPDEDDPDCDAHGCSSW
jgi:hypothetical protein